MAYDLKHFDPNIAFRCVDCAVHTGDIGEYYMLEDIVWAASGMDAQEGAGMLCIGCLETRLKRKLTPSDFKDCLLNDHKRMKTMGRTSSRLYDRLSYERALQ
jgi:hypothetical protein